jgi:hypothetical protein
MGIFFPYLCESLFSEIFILIIPFAMLVSDFAHHFNCIKIFYGFHVNGFLLYFVRSGNVDAKLLLNHDYTSPALRLSDLYLNHQIIMCQPDMGRQLAFNLLVQAKEMADMGKIGHFGF